MAPRERILASAYDLFSQRGVRDVGVDEIIATAEVAKATLYKHFPSKDDLVVAFLELREHLWTLGLIEGEARRRGATPEGRLLAIFDVFDEWFKEDDFDGCAFVNVLLEMRPAHRLGQAGIRHLDNLRAMVQQLAGEADLRDSTGFARAWQILASGSIVSTVQGDPDAARRARVMGARLIDDHRRGRRGSGEGDTPAIRGTALPYEPHDHVVNLYDDDADVVTDVSRFIADGLTTGDAVVVIATAAHRDGFAAALRDLDFDLQTERDAGRYRWLDATETLATFMRNGQPDPERFQTVIGRLIDRAGADGRPVRAFGEMVAILWDDNNVTGAIELESMWNALAHDHRFSLYCAYPMATLLGNDDLAAVGQVCSHHSGLLGPRSYRAGTTPVLADRLTDERSQLFVPVPTASRAARHFVTQTLTNWDQQAILSDAALVVSELATNAVVHAHSPFRLSISRSDSAVRIAVEDTCTQAPRRAQPRARTNGGRGLDVVDDVSTNWGVHVQPDGKAIWAELPTSS